MYETLYNLIVSMKYASVGMLTFVFPSETIMPIVGYAASRGYIWLPGAIVAGVVGTTLWSVMIYALGRLVGTQGIDDFIAKYGKFLGIRKASVDRAGKWFDHYAGVAVLAGRFVPGLRTAVCIPAGIRRMPFGRFLGYSALGSGVDVLLLALLGYTARTSFHQLRMVLDDASSVIVLSLVLFVVVWWWLRRFR